MCRDTYGTFLRVSYVEHLICVSHVEHLIFALRVAHLICALCTEPVICVTCRAQILCFDCNVSFTHPESSWHRCGCSTALTTSSSKYIISLCYSISLDPSVGGRIFYSDLLFETEELNGRKKIECEEVSEYTKFKSVDIKDKNLFKC